jgi:hypothetical protein
MGAPSGGFGGYVGVGAPPMSTFVGMGAPPGGFMASMVAPSWGDAYGDSTGNVNTGQVSNGEENNNSVLSNNDDIGMKSVDA